VKVNFCNAEEEAFNQNDGMLCKVSLFPNLKRGISGKEDIF